MIGLSRCASYKSDKVKLPEFESVGEFDSSWKQICDDYSEARSQYPQGSQEISDLKDKLCQQIKRLRDIMVLTPDCYADLLKLKAFRSMVDLLGDEGCDTDIALHILGLFIELTKDDEDETAKLFVDLLLGYNPLPVFVSCIIRLSDIWKYDEVVCSTFVTMVNMMMLRRSVADSLIQETQLSNWITEKLRAEFCDDNKRAAAGILRILLDFSEKKQITLGGMNAKQAVVKTILPYTSFTHYPSRLEQDMLDHLCDALYWLVEPDSNERMFPDAEGVELMVSIIKNWYLNYFHEYAIEILDIALTMCKNFVDAALPTYTGGSSSSDMHREGENEVHLIISLLEKLCGCIGVDSRIDSLVFQYMENNLEIIAWLMELYKRYSSKVAARAKLQSDQELIVDIFGYLRNSKNDAIRNKIEQLEFEHKISIANVRISSKGMVTTNRKKRKRD